MHKTNISLRQGVLLVDPLQPATVAPEHLEWLGVHPVGQGPHK